MTDIKELKFFADKVAKVHGSEHKEFIEVNDIVKEINENNLENINFSKLQKLTNNYTIPE